MQGGFGGGSTALYVLFEYVVFVFGIADVGYMERDGFSDE